MRAKIPVVAGLLLWAGIAGAQQPAGETYRWHGELVSVDEGARTATLKSRLAYQDTAGDLKQFKVGDRALLVWSGMYDYADAVRTVAPFAAGRMSKERFALPVELAATDAPNHYVTFRVRVPDCSAARLKTMKPGEWVTVTSVHRVAPGGEAVVSIAPYVAVSGS